MRHILVLCCLIVSLLGFTITTGQDSPLRVVATTTLIADAAVNVGGDLVEVISLVPPDSDVHAFQPTPDDALNVSEADVLLVNGAGLESFLSGLVESVGEVQPVVVSTGIEMLAFGEHGHDEHAEDEHEDEEHAPAEIIGILGDEGVCEDADHEAHEDEHEDEEHADEEHDDEAEHDHGSCDPHVWTNPQNVIIWAGNIAEAFASADPANAEIYRANAAAYITQLEALDAEVAAILDAVPDDRRVLVTNHEFFGYFAAHYGFEVAGVVIAGGSSLSEPDPQTLSELITVVKNEGVPAIFAEVSSATGLAEVVAEEAGVTVITTIYSDSLSAADGPASTYLDYLRHNAQTIAAALAG